MKTHQYQSYQGLPELREVADFMPKNYGVALNPVTEILMGSKEGIMHISLAFFE
jgi:aspartate/methionine/tyrosine aminotransferase